MNSQHAEPAQAMGEIHRVLKPGGVALLSLAALQPTVAEEEYWRFTGSGVRAPDDSVSSRGSRS